MIRFRGSRARAPAVSRRLGAGAIRGPGALPLLHGIQAPAARRSIVVAEPADPGPIEPPFDRTRAGLDQRGAAQDPDVALLPGPERELRAQRHLMAGLRGERRESLIWIKVPTP